MRLLLVLLLLAFLAPQVAAQDVALGTALPGHREASAWYGHSAIVVTHDDGRADYYTYRLYWADDVPRAVSSALGLSTFQLERVSLGSAIADYERQGRELRISNLGLDANQTTALLAALDQEIETTRAVASHYDAVRDNCSTRIRDIVNDAFDGALVTATKDQPSPTARQLFMPYMAHDLPTRIGLDLLLGPDIDRPIDRYDALFLPLELEQAVRSLDGVSAPITVHAAAPDVLSPPASLPPWAAAPGLMGLAAALVAHPSIGRRHADALHAGATMLAAGALALPAVGLFIAWTGQIGGYWSMNANILVASPLALATAPVAVAAVVRHEARRWLTPLVEAQAILAVAALALALLPVGQDNLGIVLALLPLHVGVWAGTRWVRTA